MFIELWNSNMPTFQSVYLESNLTRVPSVAVVWRKAFPQFTFLFSWCVCAFYMHCDLVILLAAIIPSFAYVLLYVSTLWEWEKKGDASHATTSTSFDRIMEFHMAKLTSRTDFDEQINMKLRHHPGKHIRNALMRCQCQRCDTTRQNHLYFFCFSRSLVIVVVVVRGGGVVLFYILFFFALILLLIIRLILSWKCCHNIMVWRDPYKCIHLFIQTARICNGERNNVWWQKIGFIS